MTSALDPGVLTLIVLCVWLSACRIVWRSGRALRQTTLTAAWRWALAALLVSGGATIAQWWSLGRGDDAARIAEQGWYWSSVITICPFISVLGGRRPTDRVWNLFIILPLIGVLGWPAVTVLGNLPNLYPIRIQLPVFVGFVVVLLMGIGNYASTRFIFAAGLAGASSLFGLLPLTTFCPSGWPGPQWLWPTLLLILAVQFACRAAVQTIAAETPPAQAWLDFQELFGLVWSARIQERINAIALQEAWGARLEPSGLVWAEGATPEERERTLSRFDHNLQWLLRRFVDPTWLSARGMITHSPAIQPEPNQ